MKRRVLLLVFLLLFLIIFLGWPLSVKTLADSGNLTGQEIADKAFDNFFQVQSEKLKHYKYTLTEKRTVFYTRKQDIRYTEKTFEYMYINDILMRKQLADENGPLKKTSIFHSLPEPMLDLDRDFFRRFNYFLKSREKGLIILGFSARSDLPVKRLLDPAANELIGEVVIREKDLSFLRLSGRLPEDVMVKIGFDHAYSFSVSLINQDFEGSVLPKTFTLDGEFTILKVRQIWHQVTETSFQKLPDQKQAVLPEYSMTPEKSDQSGYFWMVWQQDDLTFWVLFIVVVIVVIVVIKKTRRRKRGKQISIEPLSSKKVAETMETQSGTSSRPYESPFSKN